MTERRKPRKTGKKLAKLFCQAGAYDRPRSSLKNKARRFTPRRCIGCIALARRRDDQSWTSKNGPSGGLAPPTCWTGFLPAEALGGIPAESHDSTAHPSISSNHGEETFRQLDQSKGGDAGKAAP